MSADTGGTLAGSQSCGETAEEYCQAIHRPSCQHQRYRLYRVDNRAFIGQPTQKVTPHVAPDDVADLGGLEHGRR